MVINQKNTIARKFKFIHNPFQWENNDRSSISKLLSLIIKATAFLGISSKILIKWTGITIAHSSPSFFLHLFIHLFEKIREKLRGKGRRGKPAALLHKPGFWNIIIHVFNPVCHQSAPIIPYLIKEILNHSRSYLNICWYTQFSHIT